MLQKSKLISGEEVVGLIKDNDTVATGGFCGAGFAEDLAIYLEEHFNKNKRPKGLTLVYAAGQGDYVSKGLNHFVCEGLVSKVECKDTWNSCRLCCAFPKGKPLADICRSIQSIKMR